MDETKTVAKMIEELQKYPKDALCYIYEGEIIGLIITDTNRKELGCILTDNY